MNKHCIDCGSFLPEDSDYCLTCGMKVEMLFEIRRPKIPLELEEEPPDSLYVEVIAE